MGMIIQSKPIKRRPLPNELLNEINQFVPLNGLIKCGQANSTLSALAIPRAQKVHAKLISLYFADISTLAIWIKQWAGQLAQLRFKIHCQTFRTLRNQNPLQHYSQQFGVLRQQLSDKSTEIRDADQAGNILDRFNLPPAFQNELRQIRVSQIEKALAPAKFELSRWRPENNPSWNGMLIRIRFLDDDEAKNIAEAPFFALLQAAKVCEECLKNTAEYMKRRT